MMHRNLVLLGTLILALALLTGCGGKKTQTLDYSYQEKPVQSYLQQDVASNIITEAAGLQLKMMGTPAANPEDTIVFVWLHSDLHDADYMVKAASEYAGDGKVSIVVARPGRSIEGRESEGYHGTKDHYTRTNVDMVASCLQTLKRHFKTDKLIVIGHSGGSAIAGVILGKYPEIIGGAVLTSMPTDVPAWRQYSNKKGRNNWKNSLSPMDYVGNYSSSVKVIVMTGVSDEVTPSWLASDFAKKGKELGKNIDSVLVMKAYHKFKEGKKSANIAGSQEFADAMNGVVNSVNTNFMLAKQQQEEQKLIQAGAGGSSVRP